MKIKTDEKHVTFTPENEYDVLILGKISNNLNENYVLELKNNKVDTLKIDKIDLNNLDLGAYILKLSNSENTIYLKWNKTHF